jgi:hypothetical protein
MAYIRTYVQLSNLECPFVSSIFKGVGLSSLIPRLSRVFTNLSYKFICFICKILEFFGHSKHFHNMNPEEILTSPSPTRVVELHTISVLPKIYCFYIIPYIPLSKHYSFSLPFSILVFGRKMIKPKIFKISNQT